MAQAYFAAGCFWGVQAAFDSFANSSGGISATSVGYMGGTTQNPSYEEVCGGKSGHAESVKIIFDDAIIDYDKLLDLFWTCHNPSQLNRQGLDIGTQYRSAIFCSSDAQLEAAQASKQRLVALGQKIVTEIIAPPAPTFFDAEAYHQKYFAK